VVLKKQNKNTDNNEQQRTGVSYKRDCGRNAPDIPRQKQQRPAEKH